MKIYQIDAFTNQVFGGNYAAIIPLTRWLPDEQLLKIAQENNYPETAYIIETAEGFDLRWFTPAFEIDLCGHATLGAAHVIFNHLNYKKDTIVFSTQKSGKLTVSKGENGWMTMDFPARKPTPIETPQALIDSLGSTPNAVFMSRDMMAVFDTEAQIKALKPDFKRMMDVEGVGVIATAKGDNSDFVSRFFAPKANIDEDPVTGSAHCNLIPYWAEQLGKKQLHAFQISDRRGELKCELKGNRVLMSGQAVTYLIGEIFV